ncbi:uncharacterized protein LOC144632802 isoform X2 [Oculina patagonica]
MKLRLIIWVLFFSIITVQATFWDKEVEVVNSKWSSVPVAVRHVEFIGTSDNGTLDCFIPGFSQYRWELINKASSGPFTESTSLVLDDDIKEHQTTLRFGKGGFPMATEMLVVSCEAMVNSRPKFQIIWVITRLHSPLGYPTDPKLCQFNHDKYTFTTCDDYKWWFNTDCYYGKGKEYKGDAFLTKSNPPAKCQYWFQDYPNDDSSDYDVDFSKEHRNCRNPSGDYSPWCITTSTKSGLKKQFCVVQECSECMYGNGNGYFEMYSAEPDRFTLIRQMFPKYEGRVIATLKEDDKGLPRLCMSGKGWESNLCRPRDDDFHSKPQCLVAREKSDESKITDDDDSRLELVECRIPQCTVRQVWFLFFDSFGRPYLKESNVEDVEIILVNGRNSETIKFGAFGIHLASGLSINSENSKLVRFAQSFILRAYVPPQHLCKIEIKNVKKEYAGKYYVQYTFVEGNPKIQQSTYKGNFRLDVRDPMSLSLRPSVLQLCQGERGSLNVQVSGGFKVLEESIKWKYGFSEKKINKEISLEEDPLFELSANLKKITIKETQKDTWVQVDGSSYSGTSSAVGQFKMKAQPHLIAKSPSQVFALPGDEISLSIETERGLRTTWTYDAQVIPEVPDDPDMAFQRTLQKDKISEILVISSVDWRHFGIYVVETEKGGCKGTITFHLQQDQEREVTVGEELYPLDTNNNTDVDEEQPIENAGFCTVRKLKFKEHKEGNYSTSWKIDVPCYDEEKDGSTYHDHSVEELSPCSVITSYSFITHFHSPPHKLYTSVNDSSSLVEYEGDVNMKSTYIQSNYEDAWQYHYFLPEPVFARFMRFTADEVENSKCLNDLVVGGCTVVESKCDPEKFTSDDILCHDPQSSLFNKEDVKKFSACSLITSYQFASNGTIRHKMLTSGTNSMLLKMEFVKGEWLFYNSLDEPIPARYVQFIPDEADKSLTLNKLQINGCRLDKQWCGTKWSKFRELGMECDEEDLTIIYNEYPLFDLPTCSFISSYQFIAKTPKRHALLLSGNNPELLTNYREGLEIESYYYKNDEWIFMCKFASPVAARYLQFVCDEAGSANCLDKLSIFGCTIANSWCKEQSFKTVIKEYHVKTDFFNSSLGRILLKTTITSVLTPVWMFIVGRYNLDGRLITLLSGFLQRIKKSIQNIRTKDKKKEKEFEKEEEEDAKPDEDDQVETQ